jgi:hypothetical protein
MRQQHYHDPDPFSRSVQPLPPSVCGRSKGLAALPTVEVPFFARMNTNVALPYLSPGGTLPIGTNTSVGSTLVLLACWSLGHRE